MNKNKCAIVLLGPPGSGKTTLVRSLATVKRISVIETGNLLKREIRLQTPLGRQIKPYTDSGVLVPSEWVEQVISAHLKSVQSDLILFDGFPRCGEQIELFFQLLKSQHLDFCGVLVLTLDLQTAIKRLSGRRICTKCGCLYHIYANPAKQPEVCDRCGEKLIQREDDRAEVIQQRFTSYEYETMPVIESFRKKFAHLIWDESSTASLDQVIDRVGRRLKQLTRP
jgi:adenylate kinase